MRTIFDNFLRLQALNVEPVVVWMLVGIYVLLVLTSFLSIRTQSRGWMFKLGWGLVVLMLPFVGMALYATVCLWMADRSLLNQLGFFGKHTTKGDVNKPLNLKASAE